MTKTIFTIKDAKIPGYDRPFFAHNNAEAQRSFAKVLNDPTTMFHSNPEDYTLYKIGTYDDDSGVITGMQIPESVIRGDSLKQKLN